MNFAQSDPLNPLYQSIYTAIERNLTYPSEFTNRGIHGEVSATLVFSPNGEFQASLLRTRSTSKYLESLVRRALRTAFREPLSGKALHDLKTALNVDCFFSFRFVEHPSDENRKTNSTQLGSHMSFYREFQQSLLEWNVGPAHGLGPFIGLDVLWIPNKIAELLSKKAKVDPLEQYREDDSPSP